MRNGLVRFWSLLLLCLGLGWGARPARAQDNPDISGYMFGDYYWVAASHDSDLEGRNGFWFRRIYLTFDQTLSEHWSVRLRGEMDQPGDFSSGVKMEMTVKDAYVRWEGDRHQVVLGLSPTPTLGVPEDVWGYRPVEKVPVDLYGFGSSRDFGIAASGQLGATGIVRYHAMLANGSGTGTEINKGKKAMLALTLAPEGGFMAWVYGDLENGTDDGGRTTFQGALLYRGEQGRAGVQYIHQTRYVENGDDAGFDLVSVFGAAQLNDQVNIFARYDRQFQPNPAAGGIEYIPFATRGEANFIVGGLDVKLHDNVRIMPNVETVFYSEGESGAETPDPEVMPRLTFYYQF